MVLLRGVWSLVSSHEILGYEISTGRLILRIAGGFVLFAIAYFLLSYLPEHVLDFISGIVPPEFSDVAAEALSGLLHPLIPLLGLLIAILLFLEVVFHEMRVYGPILIGAGITSTIYVYIAFHGGMIELTFSHLMGLSASASLDLTALMILAMIPAILTALKGLLITFE